MLRPEDAWFAILTQLSFYVNKHAEKLRKYFVDHRGKRKLQILQDRFDFRKFCVQMADLIAENVKNPALKDWIMPSFSTTTDGDKVAAAIIMMGTMQKYFAYFGGISCGIPSVTLLGERADWQDILDRLSFLSKFGDEHEELLLWNSVLTGIISKFVHTFDEPDSPGVVSFWQRSVHQYSDNYTGEKRITGWIQAFCFWHANGNPLAANNVLQMTEDWREAVKENGVNYWLDGVHLGQMKWNDVPNGYAHVPVHLKFNTSPPTKLLTTAIAGSVGWRVVDSEAVFKQTRGPNRLRPKSASEKPKEKQFARGILKVDRTGRTQPSLDTETTLVPPLAAPPPTHSRCFLGWIVQKFLCFGHKSDADTLTDVGHAREVPKVPPKLEDLAPYSQYSSPVTQIKENKHYDEPSAKWRLKETAENAPQISDLSELSLPWEYETGGEHDALQVVVGQEA